ncbi:TPA: hypothetical protein ACXNW8_001295 [Clostridium botulinum]|uniref:hypothetical protein n=1 Tax=Clostridium botulinum TaxID=1491 RepID=UPI001C9BA7A3|nr:hypothetical protein [Clostridium botulinum]MBY6909499.1 hypothetical protein [Clostridium botulinum]
MEYVRETVTEEIISGKKMKVIVRSNRPSKEAIKRCAETMAKILVQVEERQKHKEIKE